MADTILSVGLEVEVDPKALNKFRKTLQKAASVDAVPDFNAGDYIKALKDSRREASKIVASQISAGMSKIDAKAWTDLIGKQQKAMVDASNKVNEVTGKLAQKSLDKKLEAELEGQLKSHIKEMANAEKLINDKMGAEKDRLKLIEESNKVLADALGTSAVDFSQKIGGGMNDAVNGLVSSLKSADVAGLLGTSGKGLQGLSKTLNAYAQVSKGKGKDKTAAGAEKMGTAIGKLGKSIAIFAAVAGSMAAIVKVLIDADAQAKGFNKTIVETAGAASLVSAAGGDISAAFNSIRDAALDPSFFFEFGAGAEEVIGVLNDLNAAGVTFREMTADIEDTTQAIQDLQHHTSRVITYSRLLGVTNSEMATQMGEMMDVLGGDIDDVARNMSMISDAAMESGFSVTRFNSLVHQATSGMALYNVRVGEAAGLLVELTKVLGVDAGSAFFTSITERLRGEGIQDSIRRTMIAGSDDLGDIIRLDVEAQAGELSTRFSGILDQAGKEGAEGIFDIYERITGAAAEGADDAARMQDMVTRMASMGGDEFSILISSIGDLDSGAATAITSMRNLAKGVSGSTTDVAAALDDLSIAGILATEIQTAQGALGIAGADLGDNLGAIALSVGENLGYSRDNVNQLQRVFSDLNGTFLRLQDSAAGGDEDIGDIIEGATVDAQGRIMVNGAEITDLNSLIYAQAGAIEEAMSDRSVEEDIALARQVASNTLDMNQILEFGIQYVMEQLLGTTEGIRSILSHFVFGAEDQVDESARQGVISGIEDEIGGLVGTLRENQDSLQQARTEFDQTSDPGRRGELEEEMTRLTTVVGQSAVAVENARERMSQARSARTGMSLRAIDEGSAVATTETEGDMTAQTDRSVAALTDSQREIYADATEELLGNIQRAHDLLDEWGVGIDDLHTLGPGRRATMEEQTGLRVADEGTGITNLPLGQGRELMRTFLETEGGSNVLEGGQWRHGIGDSRRTMGAGRNDPGTLQQVVRDEALNTAMGAAQPLTADQMREVMDGSSVEGLEVMEDVYESLGYGLPDVFEEQMGIAAQTQADAISEQSDDMEDSQLAAAVEGADRIIDENRDTQLKMLASEIAAEGGGDSAQIYQDLLSGNIETARGDFSEGARAGAAAAGIRVGDVESRVNDFIYRRDGTVIPIASDDEFVGMQPGGPIDRAGGGGGSVNINIYGGDENRVYDVVRRAMGSQGSRMSTNA